MKIRLNNKYIRWGVTAFCVIAAGILFYYLMFHGANIKAAFGRLADVLMPVLVGFVLAYILTPILNQIEYRIMKPLFERIPMKNAKKRNSILRGVSVFITAFLFFAVIYALIHMLVSQIVPSIMNLVSNLDSYVSNVTQLINRLLEDNPEVGSYLVKMIDRSSGELERWLNNDVLAATSGLLKTVSLSIINVLGVLWDWVIGFIISIYVLVSKEKFAGQAKKMSYAIFDKNTANVIIRNFRFTHKTFSGFIIGKVLDSIIIGLLCFIGTTLLNTPYAALVSVIIGVTNIIPFFGPWLGAVPSTVLIFLVDPTHPLNSLYFIIFILVLQQVDGNIIGPKILGNSTGLTGFWVIFAITLFGGVFGVPGMIVGVPIFAVIYAAIKSLVNTSLGKKNMPVETGAYLTVESVDDEGNFYEFVPTFKKNIDEQKQVRELRKQERRAGKDE
ncbi:MAG: AI-2E family transporter [Clostridium sp.]|nr:AI-2E family transporter [Acetatifactor muris]MCM1526540.1 AI-2E family transporter [Bacteroides sp.]MCM1562334.1 AI-2E family transporter [Clostridium sp.]